MQDPAPTGGTEPTPADGGAQMSPRPWLGGEGEAQAPIASSAGSSHSTTGAPPSASDAEVAGRRAPCPHGAAKCPGSDNVASPASAATLASP